MPLISEPLIEEKGNPLITNIMLVLLSQRISLLASITHSPIESNNPLSLLLTKNVYRKQQSKKTSISLLSLLIAQIGKFSIRIPSKFHCKHRVCPNFEGYHPPGKCDIPPF